MKFTLLKKATLIGAAALTLVTSPIQADWTTFVVAPRTSGSFTHAHQPDGRFIFGQGGTIRIQGTFGTNAFDPVSNTSSFEFDPAFIAIRNASSGLIGGGGPFDGPARPLYLFNPSTSVSDLGPALGTSNPSAYSGIWWQHPSSGRQGWLLHGTNGPSGKSNLTFISENGTQVGPVTAELSNFSGGITSDTTGAVYVGLSDLDEAFLPTAENNKILKFTADQIDTAILAIINTSPAPIARASAITLLKADASGSLAVDASGRLWIGGFEIPHIQLWDPSTNHTRRVAPLASPPANYSGQPNYQVKSFTESSINSISFLANDSFFAENSDLVLGHSSADDVKSRSIELASTSLTILEGPTSVTINLTLSSPSPNEITVPVSISSASTAIPNVDYTTPLPNVVFAANTITSSITIPIIDDTLTKEPNETLILSLGRPTPHDDAGLGRLNTDTYKLTIIDNDVVPIFVRDQSFPTNFRVGSPASHQVQILNTTFPTTWTATGLPPGLTINRTTGLISGTPTAAGDFDRVLITATNQFGRSTSTAYIISIQPFPLAAIGAFTGFFDRSGSTTNGLGGRFDLVTASTGAYTATVTVGKTKTTSRGFLSTTGANPSATISVLGNAIQFTIDSNTGAIIGNAPLGTLSAVLTGWPNRPQTDRVGVCNFAASSPTPPVDRPQGASHGSLNIPARGLTKIAGRTADGTAFTSSSALGRNGELLIYQSLYKAPGTFCGILNIADNLTQTISGNLTWSKPPQTSGALYRAGWNTPIALTIVKGGRYRPAAGASLPMDVLPSALPNATLSLHDGGIAAFGSNPRTQNVFINGANTVGTGFPLRLSINNKTGLISGSFPLENGPDKRTPTFSALLIPTGNLAAPFASTGIGHFTLPTTTRGTSLSGLLTLDPRAL
jgi:hypothetical protein